MKDKKMSKSTKRQKIDKAVKKIHTDKKQVDEILKKAMPKLRDDILKELRRREGKIYPQKGPKKQGGSKKVELGKKPKKKK